MIPCLRVSSLSNAHAEGRFARARGMGEEASIWISLAVIYWIGFGNSSRSFYSLYPWVSASHLVRNIRILYATMGSLLEKTTA
jgi:hypothetical protein